MTRSWKLSAIVAAYNQPKSLAACLAALGNQSRPPDEVVVADDGSAPEQARAMEAIVASCGLKTIWTSQEHRGFRLAASRNNGVRRSSGDYLLFIDADVVLFPDCLELHLAAAREDRWLTAYALRLTARESLPVTPEAVRAGRIGELWPGRSDPRCRGLRADARRFRIKALKHFFFPSERRLRQMMLKGLQFSLPRAALERVNGFDERYEGWGHEDLDLGLRLQLAGIKGRTLADRSRALHLFHPVLRTPPFVNRDYYARPRNGEYRCAHGLCAPPAGLSAGPEAAGADSA